MKVLTHLYILKTYMSKRLDIWIKSFILLSQYIKKKTTNLVVCGNLSTILCVPILLNKV